MPAKTPPAKGKRYPTFLCVDTDIKVAILDAAGLRLVTCTEYPLAPGIIVNGEVVDSEKLAVMLAGIAKALAFKERFVIVGISEIKATTHGLKLPPLDVDELGQAIIHEITAILPFSYKDEYLDWKVISQDKEEVQVLVSAIPAAIVDGFTMAFQKANLAPIAFETTALSLYRLIPKEGRKLSFVVELGSAMNVLILIINNMIEASSVVQEQTSVVDHLEKMMRFYVENEKKEAPQTIYLSGKNATDVIATEIKTRLKLNPMFVSPLVANIPAGRERELAVLLSLARKTVKPPSDAGTINILPESLDSSYQLAEQRHMEKTVKAVMLAMLLAVVAMLCFMLYTVTRETAAMLPKASGEKSTSILASFAPSKLILIKRVSTDNNLLINKVAAILEKKPRGITLSGINVDKEKSEITLVGIAASRTNLLTYKQILIETKLFDKVFIPLSSLEEELLVDFRIRLTTGKK